MSTKFRNVMFLLSALVFSIFLGLGMSGLPSFGNFHGIYGDLLNKIALSQRHATNIVTAVAYDYRGIDTLGEETVLFAAVIGVSLLLRESPSEFKSSPDDELPGRKVPETSEAVRFVGLGLAGFILAYGIYLIINAQRTPGGGFQGGVVLATSLLIIYLATDFHFYNRILPIPILEILEAIGLSGFVLIGLVGMIEQSAFLANFLPLGLPGRLISAGTIPLINIMVGVAVGAGNVILITEFLKQALITREGRWWR